MPASPGSEARTNWGAQLAWAVSGVVLAVLVYELLDIRGDEERAARLLQSARAGDLAAAREALEAGAAPDATSAGWSALHLAARGGHSDLVALLLEAGAPARQTHQAGWTPLHRAAEGGHLGIARMLLAGGAPIDARGNGRTALGVALATGEIALAKYLIGQGAGLGVVDQRSGNTPVLYAARQGDLRLLSTLLDRGASANDRFLGGASALHIAVSRRDDAVVQLLLARGADPDVANGSGNTPLHLAAAWGDPEIVSALIAEGADRGRRNGAGELPIDLAGGHASLAARLAPPAE